MNCIFLKTSPNKINFLNFSFSEKETSLLSTSPLLKDTSPLLKDTSETPEQKIKSLEETVKELKKKIEIFETFSQNMLKSFSDSPQNYSIEKIVENLSSGFKSLNEELKKDLYQSIN